jgi:hypothetical protein
VTLRVLFSHLMLPSPTILAAIKYLETNPAPVDDRAFDPECGVGQCRTVGLREGHR